MQGFELGLKILVFRADLGDVALRFGVLRRHAFEGLEFSAQAIALGLEGFELALKIFGFRADLRKVSLGLVVLGFEGLQGLELFGLQGFELRLEVFVLARSCSRVAAWPCCAPLPPG